MTIRYQYVLIFGFFGILAIYKSILAGTVFLMLVFANIAAACFGIALAFWLRKPEIFLKTQNGRLSLLAYLIFWPYLAFNYILLGLYRQLSQESPIDEIIPGFYLGRRLWFTEQEHLIQRGICSVMDATSEWAEAHFILKHYTYLNIPVLDSCAPSSDQLHQAVNWIDEQLQHGGVYVHCAFGHGRSTTIVAAYLLYANKVAGIQETIAFLKSKRQKIKLHQGQISALQEFTKTLRG